MDHFMIHEPNFYHMKPPFPVVSVSGSRYECGVQHGEQVIELVKHNIEYYYGWWLRNLTLDRSTVNERADTVIRVVKEYDSGLVEEMRGIADATDTHLEEIVSINGRYELAWAQPEQLMGGCTCVAALPNVTKSGNTLLAQNWDYRLGVKDTCIVLKAKVDDGPTAIMHTEAGIIGHKGLNSNGVGIVLNAMVSDRDKRGESVPFFLVCRKMLDSERFSESVGAFLNARRSVSYNIMVAGEGVSVNLEAHPEDVSVVYPEDGVLAHTNHFIGDRAFKVKDNFVLAEPSSINRYSKALCMMRTIKGHSVETLKMILTDHNDHPTSICYHPTLGHTPDHEEETISSVIMVPEERLFMATHGPPCSNEYHTIPFRE
jgi:isopenicillin-N N-acyltransferase-like protein